MQIKHFILLVSIAFIATFIYLLSNNKEVDYPTPTEAKGAYYYSFATGCYAAYLKECSMLDEAPRAECYKRGLDYCEPAAEKFKEWIDNGGK